MKLLRPLTCLLTAVTLGCRCTAAPALQEQSAGVPAAFDSSHKAWTEVLAAHVKGDTFDYKALKKDHAQLDRYLAALEAVKVEDFTKWTKNDRYAFWINAYNAYTVKRVVDGYPIASIKDLGDEKLSVWDREFVPLGSLTPDLKKAKLTLNDIENKILRPVFKDARVHAAINCASVGCPPIRAEAFVGETLDKQLDDAVKRWLADPQRNRFDAKKNAIEVCQVFDWFKDDFVRDGGSVTGWIARHAADQAWLADAKKVDVKFIEYSWKLNEPR